MNLVYPALAYVTICIRLMTRSNSFLEMFILSSVFLGDLGPDLDFLLFDQRLCRGLLGEAEVEEEGSEIDGESSRFSLDGRLLFLFRLLALLGMVGYV